MGREYTIYNPCKCPGTEALPFIKHFELLCDCSVPLCPPPIIDPTPDLSIPTIPPCPPPGTVSTGRGPIGPMGDQGPPGDKFAMVENDQGEWVGMICVEMPEARFDDLVTIIDPPQEAVLRYPLDRNYLAVCEPGTIVPASVVVDVPIALGVAVEEGDLVIRQPAGLAQPIRRITITLSGIRRGRGRRFQVFEPEVAARNNAFWSRWAHDGH